MYVAIWDMAATEGFIEKMTLSQMLKEMREQAMQMLGGTRTQRRTPNSGKVFFSKCQDVFFFLVPHNEEKR